jgi:hypothetical protein
LRSEPVLEAMETLEWIPSAPLIETGSLWLRYVCIFLLVLMAAAIICIVVWIAKLNRRRAILVEPFTSAKQLMVDLKKARLAISLSHATTFVTILSMGIRRYIEREFPHQSRTQTTEEFLQSFQQISSVDWTTQSALCDVLRFSDQVKFAGRELREVERRTLHLKACSLALTLYHLRQHREKEQQMISTTSDRSKNSVTTNAYE